MTPSPNVEALARIIESLGPFNALSARVLAVSLASRGVLATEALTDDDAYRLGGGGFVNIAPSAEWVAEHGDRFRSALARLARGETE